MIRKKGLTRYNPFKEFPTKYEEGENILTKVRRILDENEPLTDGAPLIYTPKEDGVKPEYDIRTDKWQIAINVMDRVNAYKLSDYTKNGRNPEMKETEKEGGTTTDITMNTGDDDVNSLFEDIRKAAINKLGGLVLKTYDSDIFHNWVKTDWIDGENGISKVTALKPD